MKVIGFTTLHYGSEYFEASLESIKDFVDMHVIAYSPKPSHGFGTDLKCPDTEEELKAIADKVLGEKLIWLNVNVSTEEEHRSIINLFSNGYDIVLTIDADEVFEPTQIKSALEFVHNSHERYFGIDGYVNFWRCFDFACYDGFRPIRFTNLNNQNTLQNHNCKLTIYHFSTAQSEEVTRYKYHVFGHAPEVKKDWLENTFYTWTPENKIGDLHCVSIGLWNAVEFDKNKLPEILKKHPNFNKKLI